MEKFINGREFMKSSVRADRDYKLDADIARGVPQPVLQRVNANYSMVVNLPSVTSESAPQADYFEIIQRRQSRRLYVEGDIKLDELSYLLYCTQGIKQVIGGYKRYLTDDSGKNYLRFVASSGYAYDTYLAINSVEGLKSGIWQYLPLDHQLGFVGERINLTEKLDETFSNPSQNQSYIKKAAVVFFWVCIPNRSEWIQGGAAHKLMLMDVGYISHQLYLAVESLNYGCCALAGYHQEKADELLGINGNDEYTVLCQSVGKIKER